MNYAYVCELGRIDISTLYINRQQVYNNSTTMFASNAKKKLIMWDSRASKLYLKKDQSTEDITVLGGINTLKGKLTRVQKLKAVQFAGKWIEV